MKLFPRRPPPPPAPTSAVLANDEPINYGYTALRTHPGDLPWYEHRERLAQANTRARTDPLAARIIALTTDFAVGPGPDLPADPWLLAFWRHPLNNMPARLLQISDDLARDGEVFLVLSTNAADHMTYVRSIPALQIDRIDTDPDDLERETNYHQLTDDPEGRDWPSALEPTTKNTEQAILHVTINKPAGATRGVSDLEPILPWLAHYETWLKDRIRLNRFRTAYLWHITVDTNDANAIEATKARYRTPPTAGSIIVSNKSETWEALNPNINANDAETDGHAIRLIIAAGAGIPLHYLAEPGDANRATAETMDKPTLRRFQRRQAVLEGLLTQLLRIASQRAGQPQPKPLRMPDLVPPTEALCSPNESSSQTPAPSNRSASAPKP